MKSPWRRNSGKSLWKKWANSASGSDCVCFAEVKTCNGPRVMKTWFRNEKLRGLRCCFLKRRGGAKFSQLHVVFPMCPLFEGPRTVKTMREERHESTNDTQNLAFSQRVFGSMHDGSCLTTPGSLTTPAPCFGKGWARRV